MWLVINNFQLWLTSMCVEKAIIAIDVDSYNQDCNDIAVDASDDGGDASELDDQDEEEQHRIAVSDDSDNDDTQPPHKKSKASVRRRKPAAAENGKGRMVEETVDEDDYIEDQVDAC